MKRITATALFTLAALVTTGGVMAQGRAVRATVPFDFTVGDKLLPAGNYEITRISASAIEVQNRDQKVAIFSGATYSSEVSRNGSKLVFDKYGDQYFLSEVLCQPSAINVSLARSKAEKQARLHRASLQTPTQVYVAAK
jgi:hypothetical protein